MNVAMIVNGFPELSEKFLVNQVTGLIDAGIDLDVYAAVRPSKGPTHALADRYGLGDRTIYADVPRSIRKRVLGAPALFATCFAMDPSSALRALSGRYATASRNLKTLHFLKAFGDRRYDIVHCHFGPNGLTGAFLKDAGRAARLVVSFHGSDINSYPRRYGKAVYRTLYERADLVTANTAFTASKVAANGCPGSRIEVLPVGLRMEEHPETPFASRSPLRILTVGRLVEKKGHRYVIEAIARLRKDFPGIEYVMAGDGPERGRLEALASELGVSGAVRFLGSRNDREVAALYGEASVFVLASVTAADGDMEGQGLVLQEAQASGLPVVSTLHNGIPDGVRDGETGFLVPERDSAALAFRIGELLGNPILRERMGHSGRAFVSAVYDTPILTRCLVGLYDRIISRGSRRRI
ncbi:MAG: glycosyltransferase [Spirochaetes bacterium]|nr:glycosyltransferase [Spirochaetota bacterium]